jgi:hypothetical protein
MTNNYFKVDNEFFMFEKHNEASTRKAYELAKAYSLSKHNPRTNRTPRILVWSPTEFVPDVLRVGESPDSEVLDLHSIGPN